LRTTVPEPSCIHQLVSQELGDNRIHVTYACKLCSRPTSEVGVSEQTHYSTLIELVLVYSVHHKRENIRNTIVLVVTMTSCSTATLAEKSTLHIVRLCQRNFYKGFCRKVLPANWSFDAKQKLGTSLKTNFQNLSIQ